MRGALSLIVIVALTLAAAGCGSLFMPDAWYTSLKKPPLAPPNWVFGPVWTLLYLLMAVAAWRVDRCAANAGAQHWPLGLYAAQLIVNASWTAFFFGLHSPPAALVDIAALWLLIGATIYSFARISRLAGLLLAPYWVWVSFATYLNAGFWMLNRS